MTFDEFLNDRKTINAVIRSIEVIGEATKNIPGPVREANPSVPWKKMAGMRDKMIHEYAGVDLEILWKAANTEVPAIRPLVEDILRRLQSTI